MLDVNGLEDAVEVELLLVHVASELEVVNTTIPIGIADLKEVPGIPVLGGDAHGGEAGLDLGVVKVAQSSGVEEVEETTDAGLPLLSSLPEGEENVIHGDRTGLLRRGALVGIHLLVDGGFYEAGVRSPGMAINIKGSEPGTSLLIFPTTMLTIILTYNAGRGLGFLLQVQGLTVND